MKTTHVFACLLGSALPASAALSTLTSPNGNWSLSSDEFGANGEAVGGSFAQRNFGTGLTGYSWQSHALITNGVSRQWLATSAFPVAGGVATSAGTISDATAANQRTSVFIPSNFPTLRFTLVQSATNSGLSQQYSIQNTGAAAATFSFVFFADIDLDGGTFLNDKIISWPGQLEVVEGGRGVYFSASGTGYAGFLAGHRPGGGITGDLDTLAVNNNGIPVANLNQFRDVTGGVIGADWDVNGDKVSDNPSDVGYLIQYNLNIAAGATGIVNLATIPEPSTAGLLGIAALLVRRRRRA